METKLSTGTFVGIVISLIATMSSILILAATGWQMFAFILFAIVCFAMPVALMTMELSTTLQGRGGPQLWVKTAFGPKWGFTSSWLLWVQMFPSMVMIASTLYPLFGVMIGQDQLGDNHRFTLAFIIVFYWLITLLNLKFDMAKIGGAIGIWLGVYLPMGLMFILGLAAFLKRGLYPHSMLGAFSLHGTIPSLTDTKSLQYVSAVAFIFTWILTTGVYAPRLKKVTHVFPLGLLLALTVVVLLNLVNAFLIANVIPAGSDQLDNIAEPVIRYCQVLGWPSWLAQVFSLLAFLGVALQLSTWVTGPSQMMAEVAKDGLLPAKWHFYRHDAIGVAQNVVITQAVLVSLFALLYALPNINSVFLMLVNTAVFIYCTVYGIIGLAFIRVRYLLPNQERPFRVGKTGNGGTWTVTGLLTFGILMIALTTLISTDRLSAVFMLLITLLLFATPLIIEHFKRPAWLTDAQADLQNGGN